MPNKSIIMQTDKRIGRTYVYETEYRYDAIKKKSVHHNRKLIGHLDPETGEIVPNRETKPYSSSKDTTRCFYGVTYLFDQIAEVTGIKEDLKRVIPHYADEILSLAYYMASVPDSAMYLHDLWWKTHWSPCKNRVTSQRASDILSQIEYRNSLMFCTLQARRQNDRDYWYYDTTSISSYSKLIDQIKYGHSKENKDLPQINLAILTNEKTGLPFYYRHVAGNVSDVSTISKLVNDMIDMDIKHIKICCDRGFWSAKNMKDMFENHIKFLIGARSDLNFIKEIIEKNASTIKNAANYDSLQEKYSKIVPYIWEYEKTSSKTGEKKLVQRRSYVYLYYDIKRASQAQLELANLLSELEAELATGNRLAKHEKLYDYYFKEVRNKYKYNDENIEKESRFFGYFALFGNDSSLDAKTALKIYHEKDLVEKHFANIKSRLNFRTPNVSSEEALTGKLFIMFVALIIISWLKRKISSNNIKVKSMQCLLSELATIELYKSKKNKKGKVYEITKKQKQIYIDLGIKPPDEK